MERYEAMKIYLLACLVAKNTGETVEDFLKDASEYADSVADRPKAKGASTALETIKDAAILADVEEVYKAYPARCEKRKQSTGKCSKDKSRIYNLLTKGGYTKEQLIKAISDYLADDPYIKNFSTFLNNIPDIEVDDIIGGNIGDWQTV